MGVQNFGKISAAGQRQAKRARVLLAARLRTEDGGDIDARLRDLSQKGALVECRQPLPVGSEVVFTRGNTVVPARVAWANGGRIGLEFLRNIDESEVLVQLGRASPGAASAPPAPSRFRRPRIGGEDMSENERQLVRNWGVAVGITVAGD
jgi:hypothetical protein